MNSHYQNLNSEQYIDPQQHHLQQHQQQLQHQHQSHGLNQTQLAADVFPTPAPFQQVNNRGHHSSQHETKPEVKGVGGHEEAGRASKVEEVLHFDGDKKVKVEEKPSVPRESKHAVDDKVRLNFDLGCPLAVQRSTQNDPAEWCVSITSHLDSFPKGLKE
jgi:hypothetical protein